MYGVSVIKSVCGQHYQNLLFERIKLKTYAEQLQHEIVVSFGNPLEIIVYKTDFVFCLYALLENIILHWV